MIALPQVMDRPVTALRQDVALRKGLEVRLAVSATEIDAAQALRYRVFYEEMGARPTARAAFERRDRDTFDNCCDHLLIIDHDSGSAGGAVVATYRLLRRSEAVRHGGFYSATEFDISPLLTYGGEILELGRSCVDAAYRTGAIMQLMWRGIADYVLRHDIELLFGCASLPGTDISRLGPALAYLHQHHLAPPSLRARALADRYVNMDLLPPDKIDAEAAVAQVYARSTIAALPPLVKGYLRVGGFVGDGAVVDHQFGTTDVCIVVVTDGVTDKYFNHFLRRGRNQ
jgi:L-ornithine Nalpha-acyltransferase